MFYPDLKKQEQYVPKGEVIDRKGNRQKEKYVHRHTYNKKLTAG